MGRRMPQYPAGSRASGPIAVTAASSVPLQRYFCYLVPLALALPLPLLLLCLLLLWLDLDLVLVLLCELWPLRLPQLPPPP